MTPSNRSNGGQLQAILAQLPVGAAVGLADPARLASVEPGEIVLGIGLEAAEVAPVRAGLPADAVLVVAEAVLANSGPASAASGSGHQPRAAEVVVKPAAVSWRDLHAALVQPRLQIDDALADLAQTIATLTDGLVTIEDTTSRVLAYSRSSDEVDELRRLSILGRSGPPEYLALLRQWGVYDRLAGSEEVVEIAEHAASGVRRRLAVGIFAGRRQLGTIWVQQGHGPFRPHARAALLGAARLAAAELVGSRPAGNRLADLLGGRSGLDLLGADANRPAVVAVLELVPGADDPATSSEKLLQLAAVAGVHAAGLRRRSLTERIGDRIVVLLPNLDEPAKAEAMLRQAATAASGVTGSSVRAGLGQIVRTPRQAAQSLREADAAARADHSDPVRSFTRVRNQLLTSAVANSLDQQQHLFDPELHRLLAAEAESAHTLLRYLDTGSDVSRVARDLAVHPTTVRYRLRRIVKLLEIDLGDPDDRLSVQLQLRHGLAPQE